MLVKYYDLNYRLYLISLLFPLRNGALPWYLVLNEMIGLTVLVASLC